VLFIWIQHGAVHDSVSDFDEQIFGAACSSRRDLRQVCCDRDRFGICAGFLEIISIPIGWIRCRANAPTLFKKASQPIGFPSRVVEPVFRPNAMDSPMPTEGGIEGRDVVSD